MHSGKSSLHLTPKITTTPNQPNYTMCKIQNNQNIIFYILYIKSTIKQGKNHKKRPKTAEIRHFLRFFRSKSRAQKPFFHHNSPYFSAKKHIKNLKIQIINIIRNYNLLYILF